MTPRPDASESDAQYDAMVSTAREALDAMPELSASRWVALREGVDAGIREDQAGGMGWAWGAVIVATAAALILSMSPGPAVYSPEVSVAEAPAAPMVTPAAAPQRVELQSARGVQPGDQLQAGKSQRTFDAFGRHSLALESGGVMDVVAWAPRDLAVRLRSGRVTADIAKAFPGERIQIETESAVVRVVGTQFSVTQEPSGATRVEVTEGIVDVYAAGDTAAAPMRVTAGKSHRVEPIGAVVAKPPEKPVKRRARTRAVAKPQKSPRDGFRIIEIDVPDQQAPNAR